MDLVITLVVINLDRVLNIKLCEMSWRSCSPNFIMFALRTESYGNFCVPRPSVKTVRENLGYGSFRA
jgi:hypothetical protein